MTYQNPPQQVRPAPQPRQKAPTPYRAASFIIVVEAIVIIVLLIFRTCNGGVAALERFDDAEGELVLVQEPTDVGPNPFVLPNAAIALVALAQAMAENPPAGTNLPKVTVKKVGTYGGTLQNTCDPKKLIKFLTETDPAKGRAWATAQGIDFDDIESFIGTLTPYVLQNDTLVTNFGFKNGLTSNPSMLRAGTAVLVDAKANPVVRCMCGNPIKLRRTPPPSSDPPPDVTTPDEPRECRLRRDTSLVTDGGDTLKVPAGTPVDVLWYGPTIPMTQAWISFELTSGSIPLADLEGDCVAPDPQNVCASTIELYNHFGQVIETTTPIELLFVVGPVIERNGKVLVGIQQADDSTTEPTFADPSLFTHTNDCDPPISSCVTTNSAVGFEVSQTGTIILENEDAYPDGQSVTVQGVNIHGLGLDVGGNEVLSWEAVTGKCIPPGTKACVAGPAISVSPSSAVLPAPPNKVSVDATINQGPNGPEVTVGWGAPDAGVAVMLVSSLDFSWLEACDIDLFIADDEPVATTTTSTTTTTAVPLQPAPPPPSAAPPTPAPAPTPPKQTTTTTTAAPPEPTDPEPTDPPGETRPAERPDNPEGAAG